MENSLRSVLGNCQTPRFPFHLRLGTSAAINLSTGVEHKLADGSSWEYYSVSYTIEGSTCDLKITIRVDKDGRANAVCFTLVNWLRFQIEPTSDTSNSLFIFRTLQRYKQCIKSTTKRTIDERGCDTDTNVYWCWSENYKGGLVVEECKKNCPLAQKYNEMTVAHYFAHSSGRASNRSTESDVGLSVLVKIRVSNGILDLTVKGPEKHPPPALFCLIDEVNRTGTWKPSMCPHCRDHIENMIPRYCMISIRLSCFGDGEDSDGVPDPRPPRRSSWQNTRGITNGGEFYGNSNGSVVYCRNYYRRVHNF